MKHPATNRKASAKSISWSALLYLFLFFNFFFFSLIFSPSILFAQKSHDSGLPLSAYQNGRIITFSEKNEYWLRMQDSQGFIWGYNEYMETVRFDGVDYQTFTSDPNDPGTIQPASSTPPKFIQSQDGSVWVSQGIGADKFDPKTNTFERFHQKFWQVDSLGPNFYNHIFEDSKGNFWVGGARQLYVLLKDSNTIVPIEKTQHIHLIFEDNEGKIWVQMGMSNNRLFFFRINMEEREPHLVTGGFYWNWNTFAGTESWLYNSSATLDRNSKLLLSHGRMYHFGLKDSTLQLLAEGIYAGEDVICLYQKGKTVIIGTSQNRVLAYNPENAAFYPFLDFTGLGGNDEILNIFMGNEGILWIVGQNKTYQVLPRVTPFHYLPYPQDIWATNASNGHDLLVGFGGEVYFNTKKGLKPVLKKPSAGSIPLEFGMQDFELPAGNKAAQKYPPSDIVDLSGLIFCENKMSNSLWMLMYQYPYGIKLFHFDEEGKLLDYYHCEGRGKNCFDDDYYNISMDVNSDLWMAGWQVCTKFDTDSHQFYSLTRSKNDRVRLNNRYVICNLIDQNQQVWIGYLEKGVSRYDPKADTIIHFMHDPQNSNSIISNQRVTSIAETKNGDICIGSEAGLSIWDPKTNTFRRINKSNGLPENNIQVIGVDDAQNLWMLMTTHLCLYDLTDSAAYAFDHRDGYNKTSSLKALNDKNGYLFFQGDEGVICFNPSEVKLDTNIPPIYFREVRSQNNKIDFSEEIKLAYAQRDFTVRYASLEYLFPEKITYQYVLEGYNKEWIDNGKNRSVTFTNLDPGEYIFKIKCINRHGFDGAPIELKITILPPWYRTWWASILWTAIIAGSIYWFYRFQLNRRLAESEAQRLKELDQAKSQLYTNITHEFRTPLTVILGMIDQMKADPKNWFSEGAALIKRNGKLLLNLVNQLLDLSRLESGQMPLKLVHGDIVAFLQYLTESFHSYADSKDIRLHFASDFKQLEMDYDPEKMQSIVTNLFSNAVKYTPAGGDVYLDVRKPEVAENAMLLRVRDNGVGIAANDLPHIFDRFYQVDATATRRGEGVGIGLSLTRELVKLMGGEINVESELGKGTTFSLYLPLKQAGSKAFPIDMANLPPPIAETILVETPTTPSTPDLPRSELPLVLLIEDNADVITYLSSFLSSDYRIATATDGQQGIERAIELTPDLVVSDVMMPEKDGFEVCETLKTDERTSHIPIILLTAKSDQAARLEGLGHGADAYLAKPFNKEELLVRMEKLIELRRRLQARFSKFSKFAKSEPANPEERFLQKLIGIVEENLSDEYFGLPDLCRKAALSRSQLFRKLKALTGKSTTHFIRSIRLAKGKELLETTDKNVSEVAYAVGFGSATYFARMFVEEFGVPPSEVRR